MKTIEGKRCVTVRDGWLVKVHREERPPHTYHVEVNFLIIPLGIILLLIIWGVLECLV